MRKIKMQKTQLIKRGFYSPFLLFALVLFIFGSIFILTPPVWKLHFPPIFVTRWPKNGQTTLAIGPGTPTWTSIETISKHVLNAIIVTEDARFYSHYGLDFTEIKESLLTNIKQKRYARGASTITQQVVKKAFLSQEKTIYRKFQEAVGALILETIMEKDEILEWYINLIEFGNGVYGIREAANHYFETDPERLTIQQGANLALVIPSPNAWSIGLKQKKLTSFGHERYFSIIQKMHQNDLITTKLYNTALATGDFGRPIDIPPISQKSLPQQKEHLDTDYDVQPLKETDQYDTNNL